MKTLTAVAALVVLPLVVLAQRIDPYPWPHFAVTDVLETAETILRLPDGNILHVCCEDSASGPQGVRELAPDLSLVRDVPVADGYEFHRLTGDFRPMFVKWYAKPQDAVILNGDGSFSAVTVTERMHSVEAFIGVSNRLYVQHWADDGIDQEIVTQGWVPLPSNHVVRGVSYISDDTGHVHAAIFVLDRRTNTYHGRLYFASDRGGPMSISLVDTRPEATLDTAYYNLRVRLHPTTGYPAIASQFVRSYIPGGSWANARLFYTELSAGGAWNMVFPAITNDLYRGSDGTGFTGANVDLAFTCRGEPEIAFSDVAAFHDDYRRQHHYSGQLRLASRARGAWRVDTLYRQSAPVSIVSGNEESGQLVKVRIVHEPRSDHRAIVFVRLRGTSFLRAVSSGEPLAYSVVASCDRNLYLSGLPPVRVIAPNYPSWDQYLLLRFAGNYTATYSISTPAPWLSILPYNGVNAGESDVIGIRISKAFLQVGLTYTARITAVCAEAGNSPVATDFVVRVTADRPVMPYDFNGDGITDLTMFNPVYSAWFVRSLTGPMLAWNNQWGWSNAAPVAADYNGDGKFDLGVYDPAGGRWYAKTLADQVLLWRNPWGWAGARVVPGDYDGDGVWDQAVLDAVGGRWFIKRVSGAVIAWNSQWGWTGARPVAGDYNGDGKWDQAVFDSAGGHWFIRSVGGPVIAWRSQWGWSAARLVPGDYDGDGVYDQAVFDPATGRWYIRSLNGNVLLWKFQWGWATAKPVSGDFDGDGVFDIAVVDTTTGRWYIRSLDGRTLAWSEQWGSPAGVYPSLGE